MSIEKMATFILDAERSILLDMCGKQLDSTYIKIYIIEDPSDIPDELVETETCYVYRKPAERASINTSGYDVVVQRERRSKGREDTIEVYISNGGKVKNPVVYGSSVPSLIYLMCHIKQLLREAYE